MARLGDVCKKGSSNIAQKDLEGHDGHYPIYGASGYIKDVDFFQMEHAYIAVVKDGAGIGRIMKLPAKSSVISTMQYIIPNDTVDISYLAYAMEHMNLAKYFSGATIPHIYFKDYQKEQISLPPLAEQRKIAAVLDKVSDLIAKRRQQLDKLDELVKSRFIEMFGEPVFNPLGWKKKTLKEVCIKLNDGTHFSPESFDTGEYKYVTAKNIKISGFDFTNITYVPEEVHRPIYERCNPELGDVLYIKDGVTTGIAMVNTLEEEFTLLSSVALLKQDRRIMNGHFLAALLNNESMYTDIRSNMGGAAITRLTIAKLNTIKVILPPIELQEQFAAFVAQTDKTKTAVQKSLEKLEILKKSLMQQYFG